MSEQASGADDALVTFHIKSPNDKKYTVSVPLSQTVQQLKEKLSDSNYAGFPVEQQRLIYSGHILSNDATLASYKIKEGNTVHLVKNAGSNQRQNPANSSTGSGATSTSNTGGSGGASAVPTNLSSGPGANNPLAGLTGARYAGLAHLPNQSLFGPDGGMGPPPDPDHIIHLLENPQFASTINEALSNTQVVDAMINQNPMLREMGPGVRQMMQSPEFRRMMTDPTVLRQSRELQRAMGGGGLGGMMGGGNAAFPAPGSTDTTPADANASDASQQSRQLPHLRQQQYSELLSAVGSGAGAERGAQPNALANLLGSGAFGVQNQNQGQNNTSTNTSGGGENTNPSQPQPFSNPLLNMNPAALQQFMQAFGPSSRNQNQPQNQPSTTSASTSAPDSTPANANSDETEQQNPFADIFSRMANNTNSPQDQTQSNHRGDGFDPRFIEALLGARQMYNERAQPQEHAWPGALGLGTAAGGEAPPRDTRPPEEIYAVQLGQLNDMGLHDFDRNIRALRRHGGNIEAAMSELVDDLQ